jgi:adenosylcobinamide-phosphate synthase
MGFVALILALLVEQFRPLPADNAAHRAAAAFADRVAGATNAGLPRHGIVGWFVAVGAAVASVIVAEWLLGAIGALPVLVLHVLVLYHTVGFRQFSHAFSEIQLALAANDPEGARQALQRWIRQHDPGYVVGDLPINEVCRRAIAHALVAAHRHVFGPLFWYMLLPGAIGPVLYRAAQFLAERWQTNPPRPAAVLAGDPAIAPIETQALAGDEPYGDFARRAYAALDWLPVRLAAAGFAIVGNFEDAVYCWRAAAAVRRGDAQRRILLVTGGGALGLRIADPRIEADVRDPAAAEDADPSLSGGAPPGGFDWTGSEPDAAGLRSAVGLVWRSVVLWILLFAMVTIANWLGR